MLGRFFIAFAACWFLLVFGCAMQTPVHVLRERGDAHFLRGEYEDAAANYAQVTDRYPGDWQAQYRLGTSLLETGDLTGARRALELAHSQRPGHDAVAAALAEVMFRQGDERQLFAFLRERAQSRQSAEAYRALGHYSLEMGDPDSAKIAIETAIALDDGRSVEPYLDAAALAERLGDMDAAQRRLRQAYGINPHDARVTERLRELGEVPGPSLALPPGR